MMSRGSNLFTLGIFIIFFAILFRYFCRTRKKPEIVVQQQVMPEGYVYPIMPSNGGQHQQQVMFGGQNHHQQPIYPSMPLPYPAAPGGQYPYSMPNNGGGTQQNTWPAGYPQAFQSTNQNQSHLSQSAYPNQQHQSPEDLPPPYHVAVGAGAPVSHYPPQ